MTTQNTSSNADNISAKQASDALLKLCKAKDSLHPYIGYLYDECHGADGVSCGLETALDVMCEQYETVWNFVLQQTEKEKAEA